MNTFWLPACFVLFLWWFSTGAVIYLNNLPRHTYRWSVLAATAVLAASLVGLYLAKHSTSAAAAYVSFACGLLAWAWTQLTFYTGFITGPRKTGCPPSCTGPRHFWHAVETCLHHELAAAGIGLVACMVTLGGTNHVGASTYTIIWLMHTSAKLNAVFGVRNLNEHFFPDHLRYLGAFLKQRPMNLFFPVSITVSTAVVAVFAQEALSGQVTAFQALALKFYIVILALGILEHWFLVLPIPADALWNWGLKARTALSPKKDATQAPEPAVSRHATRKPRLRIVASADPRVRGDERRETPAVKALAAVLDPAAPRAKP